MIVGLCMVSIVNGLSAWDDPFTLLGGGSGSVTNNYYYNVTNITTYNYTTNETKYPVNFTVEYISNVVNHTICLANNTCFETEFTDQTGISDGNTNWDNSYGFITNDTMNKTVNWSNVINSNVSSYYLASNPSGYITNNTINKTVNWSNIINDNLTSYLTITMAQSTYITNTSSVYVAEKSGIQANITEVSQRATALNTTKLNLSQLTICAYGERSYWNGTNLLCNATTGSSTYETEKTELKANITNNNNTIHAELDWINTTKLNKSQINTCAYGQMSSWNGSAFTCNTTTGVSSSGFNYSESYNVTPLRDYSIFNFSNLSRTGNPNWSIDYQGYFVNYTNYLNTSNGTINPNLDFNQSTNFTIAIQTLVNTSLCFNKSATVTTTGVGKNLSYVIDFPATPTGTCMARFGIRNYTGTTQSLAAIQLVNGTQWIIGTFNGTNLTIYHAGNYNTTTFNTSIVLNTTKHQFLVGSAVLNGTLLSGGKPYLISDILVYNRSLTIAEMNLLNQSNYSDITGLVARYPLNNYTTTYGIKTGLNTTWDFNYDLYPYTTGGACIDNFGVLSKCNNIIPVSNNTGSLGYRYQRWGQAFIKNLSTGDINFENDIRLVEDGDYGLRFYIANSSTLVAFNFTENGSLFMADNIKTPYIYQGDESRITISNQYEVLIDSPYLDINGTYLKGDGVGASWNTFVINRDIHGWQEQTLSVWDASLKIGTNNRSGAIFFTQLYPANYSGIISYNQTGGFMDFYNINTEAGAPSYFEPLQEAYNLRITSTGISAPAITEGGTLLSNKYFQISDWLTQKGLLQANDSQINSSAMQFINEKSGIKTNITQVNNSAQLALTEIDWLNNSAGFLKNSTNATLSKLNVSEIVYNTTINNSKYIYQPFVAHSTFNITLPKKYKMLQITAKLATSGAEQPIIRFNNDANKNYAGRRSTSSGTDSTFVNSTSVNISAAIGGTSPIFHALDMTIIGAENTSTTSGFFNFESRQGTAGFVEPRYEGYFAYVNNSFNATGITTINFLTTGGGTFTTDSWVIVEGTG